MKTNGKYWNITARKIRLIKLPFQYKTILTSQLLNIQTPTSLLSRLFGDTVYRWSFHNYAPDFDLIGKNMIETIIQNVWKELSPEQSTEWNFLWNNLRGFGVLFFNLVINFYCTVTKIGKLYWKNT